MLGGMTTSDPARTIPIGTGDELTQMVRWLDYHRATLATKCAGLTEEELRTPSVPPSELTLLGLLRHMAEMERHWFRRIMTGEDLPWIYCDEEDWDRDWHFGEQDTAAEALATWQAETELAVKAAEGRTLDEPAPGRLPGKELTLRWIYLHMIEEYARHNGHADFLRERLDGDTGA